jgi:hypothetical protein
MGESDLDIAMRFFKMLEKHGVNVEVEMPMDPNSWDGVEVTILDEVCGDKTLTFCFEKDKEFYRIMGATVRNGFYSDEIHKNNNKTYASMRNDPTKV